MEKSMGNEAETETDRISLLNIKKRRLPQVIFFLILISSFGIFLGEHSTDLFGRKGESLVFEFPLVRLLSGFVRTISLTSRIHEPRFPDQTCRITDYGAIGDGKILATQAIDKAISDCAEKGGGKVIVPQGTFLTGPIHLKSHINLSFDSGSTIIFSDKRDLYLPLVFSRFQGMELYNYSPLIYGKDLADVAITGKGTLIGKSHDWVKWTRTVEEETGRVRLLEMMKENTPVEERIFGENDYLRPSFIELINTQNILIEGITIKDSPFWTIHPVYSENITIRNVHIDGTAINSDGIVIDSSRLVLVEDSEIRSGDDAISIKSGLESDGWRVGKPSEDILIRRVSVQEGHAGISFGSEMSGGIHAVIVRDSIFRNTDTGINIKSLPGRGGEIRNLWFYHLTFAPVDIGIKINMRYASEAQTRSDHLPSFHDMLFARIRMEVNTKTVSLHGLGTNSIQMVDFLDVRANIPSTLLKETGPVGASFSNLVLVSGEE